MADFDYRKFTPEDNENMFIAASAGTGKTYTIQQIVAKLVQKNVSLDELLIVTYTEKAAGELRDRIREKLQEVISCGKLHPDGDLLTVEEMDIFCTQFELVDVAPIYTIHSFCQKTLEEFSFVAQKPSSLKLVDESSVESFIEKWIRDSLSKDPDFMTLYEMTKGSCMDSLVESFSASIGKFYLNSEDKVEESVIGMDETYIEKNGTSHSYSSCRKLIQDPSSNQQLYNSLFSRPGTASNADKTALFYQSSLVRDHLGRLYSSWQNQKEGNKQQSYNDMIRNVREALCKKDSRLKDELKKKYRYAIIDEFQDTNQKQWDIFKGIFLEDDGHSIYVVGDPKQSIYAFQGADVNVYTKALQDILNNPIKVGKGYSLSTNYRSTEEIIRACNALFRKEDAYNFFSLNGDIEFEESRFPGQGDPQYKIPAEFYNQAEGTWEKTRPLWIPAMKINGADTMADEFSFAKFAVSQIVECCSPAENSDKTKLQVFDRKTKALRNVSFSDFAVLAFKKSEMESLKNELKNCGIPFSHYKEDNLFAGIECASWISLLKAISTDDYSGYRRRILNEALYTKFFSVPLESVSDPKYSLITAPERSLILWWQQLAKKRSWAKLFDSIYSDTKIEERLSTLDRLQGLIKFRQVSDYAINYLYKNNCSLEELINHLTRLMNVSEKSDSENGSIVAKGTDYNCVQLMTVHASKGLEFPIVISSAGFRERNNRIPRSYIYHDAGSKKALLSFSDYGKEEFKKESFQEYQRLFYVAYTRAASLMILPWTVSGNFEPLNNVFDGFLYKKEFCRELPFDTSTYSSGYLQKKVRQILAREFNRNSNVAGTEDSSEKSQLDRIGRLRKLIPPMAASQHSYSSLTHSRKDKADTAKEELIESRTLLMSEEQPYEKVDVSSFDSSENPACVSYAGNNLAEPMTNYPKGANLGKAVHRIFERANFSRTGKLEDEAAAIEDGRLSSLISDCLKEFGLKVDEDDSNCRKRNTAKIVWNSLNALLPEIIGNSLTGKTFSLREIEEKNRKAEVDFNMNADLGSSALRNYFNGSIDLIFSREINGKKIYAIADWKTDTFANPESYADHDEMENAVSKNYSIQRVLYSYALIKWLRQFSPDKDEQYIFENSFGGIYYILVRGCKAGNSNGIYARTWKSWKELEDAFEGIKNSFMVREDADE